MTLQPIVQTVSKLVPDILQDFALDLLAFFKGTTEGHMERWEYMPADFNGDPAGGSVFWDRLVQKPGHYYLPDADIGLIQHAVKNALFLNELQRFDTIVELGPGNARSISEKTIPILKYAKNYVAVDLCADQGNAAAVQVLEMTGLNTASIQADYHENPIPKQGRKPTAFVMWGAALGNIAGHKGDDPKGKLAQTYTKFASNCNEGDAYIIPFDSETDAEKILAAYHEPLLSKKFLSVLFAAKKYGLAQGNFDPAVWCHRSEFYPEFGQTAHILYPTTDQEVVVLGQRIKIAAYEPRIENNSYKFQPKLIAAASKVGGFNRTWMVPSQPMSLSISVK